MSWVEAVLKSSMKPRKQLAGGLFKICGTDSKREKKGAYLFVALAYKVSKTLKNPSRLRPSEMLMDILYS